MLLLIAIHITVIRLQGVTEFQFKDEGGRAEGPSTSSRTTFYTELIIGLVLMIVLSALATIFPATWDHRPTPLQTPEVIKPEWFFYVAFRWLKLFTGTAAVLSMGFIVFVMFAWPFIDNWIRKQTRFQEASVWIGIARRPDDHRLTVWEAVVATLSRRVTSLEELVRGQMTLETKRIVIATLGGLFLLSLVLVQWMETARKAEEAGLRAPHVSVPANSKECVDCHARRIPASSSHWEGSTHAEKGVGCVECHKAEIEDEPTATCTTASRSRPW